MGLYAAVGKRLFDLGVGTIVLIVTSPLVLLTALVIWLDDRNTPIFRQQRVGRSGRPFRLTKFRTMPVGTPDKPSRGAKEFKITRIGSLLRRTSLDELPQLWNILKGDMSIVGPRPALPVQSSVIEGRRRVGADQIKPGVTGLAQLHSYDNMPEEEKVAWDGKYAANVTFLRDIGIIFRTIGYVFRKPPSY